MTPIRDADLFWKKLILPEEDRPPGTVWVGCFRWFRSPNVVPIERYMDPTGRARISDWCRRLAVGHGNRFPRLLEAPHLHCRLIYP